MDNSSAHTWLVALPVLGGGLGVGLGFVIPGITPILVGLAGLALGATAGVVLVVRETQQATQANTQPATDGSAPGLQSASNTDPVSTTDLTVTVVDGFTGDRLQAPVDITATQSFTDDEKHISPTDGQGTLSVQTLTWTITAAHDGHTTTTQVDTTDTTTVELALPPKKITLTVVAPDETPLPEATVHVPSAPATIEPLTNTDTSTHHIELPATTDRATLHVDAENYEETRTDVILQETHTATTITLTDAQPTASTTDNPAEQSPTDQPNTNPAGTESAATPEPDSSADAGEPSDATPEKTPPVDTTRTTSNAQPDATDDPTGAAIPDQTPTDDSQTQAADKPDQRDEPDEDPTSEPTANQTPIPEVGITGIDLHTPPYSSNPPRVDLPDDVLEGDPEDRISDGAYATVTRREIDARSIAVKSPGENDDSANVHEAMATHAADWYGIDDHANIATLVDADTTPYPYTAIEYAPTTLAELETPRDQTEALWQIARLADAITYAHENDVLHLNMKPTNVLVEQIEDNSWPVFKLTDWDLPRLLDLPSEVFKPVEPAYAAPEQTQPAEFDGADERTDVYQLGILAHELLTGNLPLDGDHATRAPVDPTPIPSPAETAELNDAVDDILQTATATRKEHRYASAKEFRDDVRDLAASIAGGF